MSESCHARPTVFKFGADAATVQAGGSSVGVPLLLGVTSD